MSAFLAEFGRRALSTTWMGRVPGPWIHFAPLAAVLLALYAITTGLAVPPGPGFPASALSDDHRALLQATADRAALTLTTSRLYAKNLAQAEMLRQTNLQLQEKVAERTEALEQANTKLEQLATHDGLTGLLNRRHLDDVLGREGRRSKRRGEALYRAKAGGRNRSEVVVVEGSPGAGQA